MTPTADARLAVIAAAHHGVFTRDDAVSCGLSRSAIRRRIDSSWETLHPGTFRLPGNQGGWHQDLYAACAWAKDGIASHRAAGALFGLPGTDRAPVEITVHRCRLAPRSGIKLHHTDKIPDSHRSVRLGIPCASIERTLLDLGAVWPKIRVAAALDDALRRELTTVARVDHSLGQIAKRGRRGVKGLRELLRERWMLKQTPHSPLETRLFQLLAESSLPLPELQYTIMDSGVFVGRVDFCYPHARLVIEAESWKHHSGREDWGRDVERRNRIIALGWRVLQVTWSDVAEFPDRTIKRIADLVLVNSPR